MQDKAGLIFRSVLILLIIAFLIIFYQYSQNGRYSYHKEIQDVINNKYVVDTRTGIIYGMTQSSIGRSNFYEINLKTGKVLIKPYNIIDKMSTETQKSPSK